MKCSHQMLDFLDGTSAEIARRLLGMTLVSLSTDGDVALRITETEAYAGHEDPASHAYRRRNKRNEVMFDAGGILYVYRSHGIHWCCNVVTGPAGVASAVLLRAGEVVRGQDVARRRRGIAAHKHKLASGPGNLAQALGINGADNGASVADGKRFSLSSDSSPTRSIDHGPRVGVTQAPDIPWRFWIVGDASVSAYRRSARAGASRTR